MRTSTSVKFHPIDGMIAINPGVFIHRIEYQSSTAARGSSGSVPPSWNETTPFVTVYASVDPLTSREVLSNLSNGMETTHRITHWYVAGLLSEMRIKFGTRYFDILGIRNFSEKNVYIEVLCKEGRSQGS
jgi:SPP1 family predicted phage head-tail adaptor